MPGSSRGRTRSFARSIYPHRRPCVSDSPGVQQVAARRERSEATEGESAGAGVHSLQWKLPDRAAEVIPSRYLTTDEGDRSRTCRRPPSRRTTAASAGNAARRSPRHGIKRRPTPPSKPPATSSRTSTTWPPLAAERIAQAQTARLRQAIRRTCFPPAAHRRRKTTLRRSSIRNHQGPRAGDQARRAADAQVAALPLPRTVDGEGWLRGCQPAVVRAVGFAARTTNCSRRPRPASWRARDEVAKQAERMLADPRAKVKLRDFLHTWLKVDQPRDVNKDPKRFPGFDPAVVVRPAHVARSVPRRSRLVDAADFRRLFATTPSTQWSTGEVLRRLVWPRDGRDANRAGDVLCPPASFARRAICRSRR